MSTTASDYINIESSLLSLHGPGVADALIILSPENIYSGNCESTQRTRHNMGHRLLANLYTHIYVEE